MLLLHEDRVLSLVYDFNLLRRKDKKVDLVEEGQ